VKLWLAALALLAGCTMPMMSDDPPPADWPELKVIVVTMDDSDVRAMCKGSGAVIFIESTACVIIAFGPRTCLIVESREHPMTPAARAHEGADGKRGHCQGVDHAGEDTLRRAWEAWKSKPVQP